MIENWCIRCTATVGLGAWVAFGCAVPRAPQPASTGQRVESTVTVPSTRAVWVTGTTLASKAGIQEMVERASRSGFNTVFVQVRVRGDALYRSTREPPAESLREGPGARFDPLDYTLRLAHRRGLEVHAWINGFVVTRLETEPSSAGHVSNRHPGWLAVPAALADALYYMDPWDPDYRRLLYEYARANRDAIEGLYLSPGNRAARDFVRDVAVEVATRYPVDGVHLDYVRYPNREYSYDRESLVAFRSEIERGLRFPRRHRLAEAAVLSPRVYADSFPEDWARFRRAQVTAFVRDTYRSLKARRPDLVVSAAVVADPDDARHERYQDWPGWLAAGLLDVVCPMAYVEDTEAFRRILTRSLQAVAGRAPIWAGIGAWRIPVHSTVEKIRAAQGLGASGIVLFSYEGALRADAEGALLPSGAAANQADEDYLSGVGRRAFGTR